MLHIDRSSSRITLLRNRRLTVTLLVAVAVIVAVGYLFSQRHVFKASVRPDETTYIDVEVPMQRLGRTKSFAKERGLPVTCTVSRAGRDEEGVQVSVVETGHSVHRLRARLRIHAVHGVAPGRIRRSIEFAIDGHDGWPTATLVVDVRRSRS